MAASPETYALRRLPASLSVSEHGVVEGSVEAQNVVFNGRINGDILAVSAWCWGQSARTGNVHYGAIEMALGAEIIGKLVPRDAPDRAP